MKELSLRTAIAIGSSLLLCGFLSGQTKRALLIGINTYEHPDRKPLSIKADGQSRFELLEWENLDGAINDLNAVRDLLASPKFGFSKLNILLEDSATRDGILKAMHRYLVEEPDRGDTVVFYYAGHGSLRKNSQSIKRESHLDNTIVPSDAATGTFDVRDREIARIFNQALDKGVLLTAIFDSCHSGTIGRGIVLGAAGKTRYLAYDPRDINEGPDMKDGKAVVAPEDRQDNSALVFSATQPDQQAQEWSFERESHGAFTLALIRALQSLPADTPAKDVYKRVKVVMEGMGLINQQPVLDGTSVRQQHPLLGKGTVSTKVRIAVSSVTTAGLIVLDAGIASDLGVGTELDRVKDGLAQTARLRIRSVSGLTRSTAEIVGSPAKIAGGDLFEVTKWVPAESTRLPVWTPPSTLSQQQVQDAANAFAPLRNLPGIKWVDDPARQALTHMVWWNGKQWILSRSGSSARVGLGVKADARLVADKLKGSNGSLLIDLPPSTELYQRLGLDAAERRVRITDDPASALYLLVGSLAQDHLQYAWLRRTALDRAFTATGSLATRAVCAPDSPYPARSDWARTDGNAPRDLATLISRLAKLHAWLGLPIPPQAGVGFPYRLALKRRSDGVYITEGIVREGESYDLVLKADGRVPGSIAPRWVYVLGIDCSGEGGLLFPNEGGENRFPQEGQETSREIVLPSKRSVDIGEPFGFDTYVLLTTEQQLPDPEALKFEAVVSRAGAKTSPLQNLLGSASAGTRSRSGQVPTNWSVQYLHVHSLSKGAPQ